MATSQVPTSNSVTTQALLLRRFELMAAEHVARIGARMAQRRKELDLTQREVADLIPGKADSNQVSKWERGEHKPGDDTLEHIAKALKVDPSYFHIAEPIPGTPDLMDSLDGADQLDRIEAGVNAIIAYLGVDTEEAIIAGAERDLSAPRGARGAGGSAKQSGAKRGAARAPRAKKRPA